MMDKPIPSEICTSMGAKILGMISLRKMRGTGAPRARAASTYSLCLTVWTVAYATRMKRGV
jgi:hypothetical protein